MSEGAKAGLAVVLCIPAFMAAALLFSPLAVLTGYGLDAAIGQRTDCSISTLDAAISGFSPLAQVAALAGEWLLLFASMMVSLWWFIGLVLMTMSGANEVIHNMGAKHAGYSTASLIALAVLIPFYSQGICLAT